VLNVGLLFISFKNQKAVLSPHDAAVNFDTHSKFTGASRGFHCDSNAFV